MGKTYVLGLLLLTGFAAGAEEVTFPSEATPGACYTKVTYQATYKTVQVQELVQKASSRFVNIPAKYATAYKSVKVKDASEKVVTVPAQYKEVRMNVKVADAETRVEKVPAVYESVAEKVMVRPARMVWREGEGPHQKVNADGKIVCLVNEPAEYKTVYKSRLSQPATTRTTVVPARYEEQVKTVLVRPETTKVVRTAAVYKSVPVKKLVRSASRRRLDTPAKYRTVTKRVVDQPRRTAWEEVICRTNATTAKMLEVQNALIAQGVSDVRATGNFDEQTQTAIEKYQREKGLPVGYLNRETLESLGVAHIL